MKRFDGQSYFDVDRVLPQERAVALSVGGSTHAVMMATPQDLDDFAYGFLFTEGVISSLADVAVIEIVETELGLDVQIRLAGALGDEYRARQRAMVGPVGCGLCGVESLELAVPELAPVQKQMAVDAALPFKAIGALGKAQRAREISGAMHGAALVDLAGELVMMREDIGRHNAVDKVLGAALRQGENADHLLVVSSRVSLDLVIKAVRAGIGTLIARASPSDLAYQYAQNWGLQLIAPVFADEYFLNDQMNGGKHERG